MAAVGGVVGSSRSAACCAVLLAAVLFFSAPATTEAYDSLDPNGNITIKWDIIFWTPDGYVATVTMTNYQQFRNISAPGWRLGWSWAKKEVIWAMVGARATKRGDCSKFKRSRPHCCKRDPTIVDLLPGTPFNQQVTNCCKAGVLKTFNQDPGNAASSFQITVGLAGTTNRTVMVPKKFTLKAPGPGYTWACSCCHADQVLFLGRAQGNPSFHVMECNLHIPLISCSEDSDLRFINPHRNM